jgi:hypothetical protein
MVRVLVSGGREFDLVDEVHRILMPIHTEFGIAVLGHGDAEGADTLCKLWALSLGIETKDYECTQTEWDLYGHRAGRMRNSRMLREFKPDIGVIFPGGRGTSDMKWKMDDVGLPYYFGKPTLMNPQKLFWELKNGKKNGR